MAEHAVMDYRRAKARLEAEPDDAAAKAMVGEVEEFLESDWFRELLDISELYVPRGILEETGR